MHFGRKIVDKKHECSDIEVPLFFKSPNYWMESRNKNLEKFSNYVSIVILIAYGMNFGFYLFVMVQIG